MDPLMLAKELAPYLSPVLPYLFKWVKSAGQESAKAIGEELGKKIPESVIKLWEKLWEKGKEDPVSQVIIQNAAEKPEDQAAQSALESQLSSMLSDNTFRSEIAKLLENAKTEMPTLKVVMNIDNLKGTAVGVEGDLKASGVAKTEVQQTVKSVEEGGVLKGAVLRKDSSKS